MIERAIGINRKNPAMHHGQSVDQRGRKNRANHDQACPSNLGGGPHDHCPMFFGFVHKNPDVLLRVYVNAILIEVDGTTGLLPEKRSGSETGWVVIALGPLKFGPVVFRTRRGRHWMDSCDPLHLLYTG